MPEIEIVTLSVCEGSHEILRAKALRMTVSELFIAMTTCGLLTAI